jgi:hypothetical protein
MGRNAPETPRSPRAMRALRIAWPSPSDCLTGPASCQAIPMERPSMQQSRGWRSVPFHRLQRGIAWQRAGTAWILAGTARQSAGLVWQSAGPAWRHANAGGRLSGIPWRLARARRRPGRARTAEPGPLWRVAELAAAKVSVLSSPLEAVARLYGLVCRAGRPSPFSTRERRRPCSSSVISSRRWPALSHQTGMSSRMPGSSPTTSRRSPGWSFRISRAARRIGSGQRAPVTSRRRIGLDKGFPV